jgi:hypothetical protein
MAGNLKGAKDGRPFVKNDPRINRAGHPKGQRNLSTILREMLDEKVDVIDEHGNKVRKQFQDVLVRKLIKKANDGDLRAIQEVFNRLEGMPKQKTEVENTGEITVRFIEK